MKTLGHDLDELSAEARMSEDKAKNSMIDATQVADELCNEQDHAMLLEKQSNFLEAQIKDAQNRSALKGGKTAISNSRI